MSSQLNSRKNSSFLSSRSTIPHKLAKKDLTEIAIRMLSKGPQRPGIGRDHRGTRTCCLYRDIGGKLGVVQVFPEDYQQKIELEKGYTLKVAASEYEMDSVPDCFGVVKLPMVTFIRKYY